MLTENQSNPTPTKLRASPQVAQTGVYAYKINFLFPVAITRFASARYATFPPRGEYDSILLS